MQCIKTCGTCLDSSLTEFFTQLRHDYMEGMTAVKEKRRPQWDPAQLEDVDLQKELAKKQL